MILNTYMSPNGFIKCEVNLLQELVFDPGDVLIGEHPDRRD